MKRMDFFVWQGARRRHSPAYGNDEQRRHTEKDAVSCRVISEADHKPNYSGQPARAALRNHGKNVLEQP
jgi:hypothetical protein